MMQAMLNAIPDNLPIPPDRSTGLVPRDYGAFPVGCMAFAPEFPDSLLIDEKEIAERLAENRAKKAGLLDIRENDYDMLKSLDQDGLGLCWNFSFTKAVMYVYYLMGNPIRLSPWWGAGIINGWRDRGGWGANALKLGRELGVPAESYCPAYKSQYDTKECRENALLHRVMEYWDGSDDPEKAQHQAASMIVQGVPGIADYNDMGHSMCLIDLAGTKPYKFVHDNSWGSGDNKGLYIGTGRRALPDGLVFPRVANPSTV